VPTKHRDAINDSEDHSLSLGTPLPTRLVSVGAVDQSPPSSSSRSNMAVIYYYYYYYYYHHSLLLYTEYLWTTPSNFWGWFLNQKKTKFFKY